uniref:(California timema) hypothetical protein n=1 Tax=Timema californicum TaxID=61474 RepID=A0A7R9PB11_TIMCA|nr:unnamed protein product [Timema californicum]
MAPLPLADLAALVHVGQSLTGIPPATQVRNEQRERDMDRRHSRKTTSKPSIMCWSFALLSGIAVVSVFIGVTLWIGMGEKSVDKGKKVIYETRKTMEEGVKPVLTTVDKKRVFVGSMMVEENDGAFKVKENNVRGDRNKELTKNVGVDRRLDPIGGNTFLVTSTTDLSPTPVSVTEAVNILDKTEEASVREIIADPRQELEVGNKLDLHSSANTETTLYDLSSLSEDRATRHADSTRDDVYHFEGDAPSVKTEDSRQHFQRLLNGASQQQETDKKEPQQIIEGIHTIKNAEENVKVQRTPLGGEYNFNEQPIRRFDEHLFQHEDQPPHVENKRVGLDSSTFNGMLSDGFHKQDADSDETQEMYYYYPSASLDRYDGEEPDRADNPIFSFLQVKLQELHDWISSDSDVSGVHDSDGNDTKLASEFKEVLVALNGSIAKGNSTILLTKLKELYYNSDGDTKINVTDPALLSNSSSLVSFGLLAFDLLLLHNVQQIAWDEDKLTEEDMMKDPEILALNSLFMTPSRVRELQNPSFKMAKNSDEAKVPEEPKGLVEEVMEFVNSALRGVLNLGRAYRRSAISQQPRNRENATGTPLDCIWTLYCRNLDKTSRLRGPYGFLAKMNSFGLRLVMGEFPVEHILETLVREFAIGWSSINCHKLFPSSGGVLVHPLHFPRQHCLKYIMLHSHVNHTNYFFPWEKTLHDQARCSRGGFWETPGVR